MPRSIGSPPAATTMPATAKLLEATICAGPSAAPGATSSSPVGENGDARAPAHGERRVVGGGGERDVAGVEAPARAQAAFRLREVEPARAHVVAGRDAGSQR